jgi:hypothetical protein
LFETENKVVRLFDYLYFELHQVDTPAAQAFIEPFGKCFHRERAYVGSELNKIGAMWGTSPELWLKAAHEALEADNCAPTSGYIALLGLSEHHWHLLKFETEIKITQNSLLVSYNLNASARSKIPTYGTPLQEINFFLSHNMSANHSPVERKCQKQNPDIWHSPPRN